MKGIQVPPTTLKKLMNPIEMYFRANPEVAQYWKTIPNWNSPPPYTRNEFVSNVENLPLNPHDGIINNNEQVARNRTNQNVENSEAMEVDR